MKPNVHLAFLCTFLCLTAATQVSAEEDYDVDPDDPAHWGTLIRPSPLLWDRVFLWSNYHIEHHYFPRVPFYNLPRLHKHLRGFFEKHDMRPRTYGGLLWDWLIRNRTPHTDWSKPTA